MLPDQFASRAAAFPTMLHDFVPTTPTASFATFPAPLFCPPQQQMAVQGLGISELYSLMDYNCQPPAASFAMAGIYPIGLEPTIGLHPFDHTTLMAGHLGPFEQQPLPICQQQQQLGSEEEALGTVGGQVKGTMAQPGGIHLKK